MEGRAGTVAGLMALYPLCRHRRPPRDAIVHAAETIEQRMDSASARADALTVLGIFSRLGYPNLDPFSILGRKKMEESLFYQDILREGEIKKARAYVIASLKARFSAKAAAGLTKAVNAIEDLEETRPLASARHHLQAAGGIPRGAARVADAALRE